jgi:ABC-type glutathione transport system ATPase component
VLQNRGLSRTEHTGRTSRDHSGLPRPPGRISERGADARPVPLGSPTTTRLTFMGDGTRDGDTAGPDAEPALSVRGLTKTYRGGFTAIEGLDLDIPAGAFLGLLGPNGAGKTTLIGAVCNLLRPTAGEIQVFGHHHESREARRERWVTGGVARA